MMISTAKNLGFICVPKCGSTAIEHCIRPHCNIKLSGNPKIKHMTYRDAERFVFPMLESKGLQRPHMFAVIREPLDWIASWYRYRSREALIGTKNYAGGHDFSDFARLCCSTHAPSFAKIQNQAQFFHDHQEEIAVDTIISFDSLRTSLPQFLYQFDIEVAELPEKNVSPRVDADINKLDRPTRDLVAERFQQDYEIYNRSKSNRDPKSRSAVP